VIVVGSTKAIESTNRNKIPKRLTHEELIRNIPEKWLLEDIIKEPKVYNTQIKETIQDGTNIRLRMNRSSPLKIREPQMIG